MLTPSQNQEIQEVKQEILEAVTRFGTASEEREGKIMEAVLRFARESEERDQEIVEAIGHYSNRIEAGICGLKGNVSPLPAHL